MYLQAISPVIFPLNDQNHESEICVSPSVSFELVRGGIFSSGIVTSGEVCSEKIETVDTGSKRRQSFAEQVQGFVLMAPYRSIVISESTHSQTMRFNGRKSRGNRTWRDKGCRHSLF